MEDLNTAGLFSGLGVLFRVLQKVLKRKYNIRSGSTAPNSANKIKRKKETESTTRIAALAVFIRNAAVHTL